MQLKSLYTSNFRCLSPCNLEFSPGVHCIVGDNAAGKTSVLEAIHILCRGESFRQTALKQTIHHDCTSSTLRTQFYDEGGSQHRVGCNIIRNNYRFKLNNQPKTRRFDLINILPLQHIDPNVHRLMEQGPGYRRNFLDWGVFHVEHAFFPAWRRYRRALKQRNRSLRENQPNHQITAWDSELVRQGEIIDACRRHYLEQIKKRLPETVRNLVNKDDLAFSYNPGWRGNQEFRTALANNLNQDKRAGFTQQGPHRADMHVSISSVKARDWVSRGQQKLLTSALLLVQITILQENRKIKPVLLMDDMAAELGSSLRAALAEEVRRLGVQCFLTFLGQEQIPEPLHDSRMFHVEHGRIKTL